jgi:plastocyanin
MPRHHLRMTCLLALAGVPLLAACGADDPAVPSPPAAPAAAVQTQTIGRYPAPAAALPAEAPTSRIEVRMAASQFEPAQLTVAEGQTVRWSNADAVAHTVTATSGAAFDSGTIEAGGEFSWTATRAGRVSYACVFHPGMTGTILVR